MKNLIITVFLILLTVPLIAQSDEGKIVNYNFNSTVFKEERALKIFLPIEYETQPNMRFPVVYLLDAQDETLFNLTQSTIDFLIASYEMQPTIVVGVISKNRQYEFLPKNRNKETLERYKLVGGASKLTESFKKEVFPYLKENYRINNTKLAIGHSLSGTYLAQTLIETPELFNALLLISPNFVYDNEQLLDSANTISSNIKRYNTYVFSVSGNIGALEKEFNPAIQKIDSLFKRNQLKPTQWSHQIIENYNHGTILLQGIHKGLLDYSSHFDLSKLNNRGYNYLSEGNFEDAFISFQRGIDLYPNDSNIYDSFGEAKEKSGDLKQAKAYYALAIEKLKNENDKYSEEEFLRRQKTYQENFDRVTK